MDIEKINETLFSQARDLRMCDDVHRAWYGRCLTVDELFDLYYRNLDFCTDYRWPGTEEARELFTDEERHAHGVVMDEKWSLLNPTHSIVTGKSNAKIRYNGFNVARTTIMDKSFCDISVKGHAFVTIHLYDKARINIVVETPATAMIIKHSNDCRCTLTGQATIKECI